MKVDYIQIEKGSTGYACIVRLIRPNGTQVESRHFSQKVETPLVRLCRALGVTRKELERVGKRL